MRNLKGKRIALVGGAGFIGHNLAVKLKELGGDVHVIDSLQVNNIVYFQSYDHDVINRKRYISILQQRIDIFNKCDIPLYIQDVRDYSAISKLLKKISPDVIIHLAAVSHAGRSNKDPYSTFDHSLRTLENTLDFSRDVGIDHFIYFSSSMVYGDFPESGLVTEESPCNPIGIYGALKFAGEKLVIAYNQVFDLSYTIVRPSALYGERCVSRRVGQIFIENAMEGKDVVVAGDGADRLDFTYIDDLCEGICNIVEKKKSRGEIFNMTFGESRSVMDLYEILKSEFPKIKLRKEPRDKLTPVRGTLSVEKARKLIGYSPKWPLEKGMKRYIEWYKGCWKKND